MASEDSGINRFQAHTGLYQLANSVAGVFTFAVLLKHGVPPAIVFLAWGGVFLARFLARPLVIQVARRLGLRGATIAGAAATSVQYLFVANVGGVDGWLAAWVVVTALGDVVYWTLFHVMFAALGTQERYGRQTSVRQIIMAVAGIAGPPVGGLLLTWFPPIVAFSVGSLLRLVSIAPLLGVRDPPFETVAPANAWRAAWFGALIFMSDGWTVCCASVSWSMIVFLGLGERYDRFGAALAAAGLVGALGGMALGRLVDLGRGRRAVTVSAAASVAVYLTQIWAGFEPERIFAAMMVAALLGGLSLPSMMPAIYSAVRAAPCSLRFQVATEAGWDAGAIAGSLACASLAALGLPLRAAIALAIPMILAQALVLAGRYGGGPAPRGAEAMAAGD